MDAALHPRRTSTLQAEYGRHVRIASCTPCAGGSQQQIARLLLSDGSSAFLKYATRPRVGIFRHEAEALSLLTASSAVRVPRPIASDERFLLTEWMDFGPRASDWEETLGRGLALLHQRCRQPRFGFDADNYLGLSKQPNAWRDNWLDFWRTQRLEHQLELWRQKTGEHDTLSKLGARLLERLDHYLGEVSGPAVLLHGDLWSGNAAADARGAPVIFDPASYYGHHEAEFGMMRLFGGFGPRVEAAYGELWPFAPGSEERIALYRLYHELNHVNLFGGGYYDQCLRTIRALL